MRADLPAGDALAGSYAILDLPKIMVAARNTVDRRYTRGFEIARAEKTPAGTWVHTRADHGLRALDNRMFIEEYAPKRAYRGAPRLTIHETAYRVRPPRERAASEPAALRGAEAVDAGDLVKGIEYRYWEGPGGPLFEYRARKPLAEGVAGGFLSAKLPRATGGFAVEYTGYVHVPRDGVYEFGLVSEGVARFEVGRTTVVRRDVVRASPERAAGSITLREGFHPVTVAYTSGGYAPPPARGKARRGFLVDWQGPDGVPAGSITFHRPANRVAISPAGGLFEGRVVVTLSPDREGDDVRFTLDGSEPHARSSRYRRPFRLRRPATVKARVFGRAGDAVAGGAGPVAEAVWALPAPPAAFGPEGDAGDGHLVSGLVRRSGHYAPEETREFVRAEAVDDASSAPVLVKEGIPFAERLDGFVNIPRDGVYTFYVGSPYAAQVRVAGEEVAITRGGDVGGGSLGLGAGMHAFWVERIVPRSGAPGTMELSFEGPGLARRRLGRDDFRRARELVRVESSEGVRFSGRTIVELSPERDGATVRYTLDGSEPTEAAALYEEPFVISGTVTVKAKVLPAGPASVGAVSSATFVRTEPRPAEAPERAAPGLAFRFHTGHGWTRLPDFQALGLVREGTVPRFELPKIGRPSNYAIRLDGYLRVPAEGLYRFFVRSEDGAMLFVGGERVVDNDGLHDATKEQPGRIALAAGKHRVALLYFAGPTMNTRKLLEVLYEGPGIEKQPVPAEALSHEEGRRTDRAAGASGTDG